MTKEINIFDSIFCNRYQEVKAYINNGGDVNAVDEEGETLALLALDARPRIRLRIFKLLVKHGAVIPTHRDVIKSSILPGHEAWDYIIYNHKTTTTTQQQQ